MVSCLMGDSTALASAIVRCCLRNIPNQHIILENLEFCISFLSAQRLRQYLETNVTVKTRNSRKATAGAVAQVKQHYILLLCILPVP